MSTVAITSWVERAGAGDDARRALLGADLIVAFLLQRRAWPLVTMFALLLVLALVSLAALLW